MKTGHIITISIEDYLRNEVAKDNEQEIDDKLKALKDKIPKMHNSEHIIKLEAKKKGTNPKVTQQTEYRCKECNEMPPPSKNAKAMNKWEPHKEMQKWGNFTSEIRVD